MRSREVIAIVAKSSRMDMLRAANATAGAAEFVLEQNAKFRLAKRARMGSENMELFAAADQMADFGDYEEEDQRWKNTLSQLRRNLDFGYRTVVVQRDHLPNFDFGRCVLVVVVGPDGLVANAAKYVGDTPIIGVNPDPTRNDGVLLPFEVDEAREAAQGVIQGRARLDAVTLAEMHTHDGQRLLAFNDFFIGRRGHASARYTVTARNRAEPQSSSGIIISTGAGSTGWFSSICNMVRGLGPVFSGRETSQAFGHRLGEQEFNRDPAGITLPMDRRERRLLWAVREPFISRHSQATLMGGVIEAEERLTLESIMPDEGVIFSDGLEHDYVAFNSGVIADFFVSEACAQLVVRR